MATYKDYYDAGFACESKSDWNGAIANFSKAISKAQNDAQLADAYAYRGSMYEGKGDHAKAEADLKKAVDYGSVDAANALKQMGVNYTPKRKKVRRSYSGGSSSYKPKLNFFLAVILGVITAAGATEFTGKLISYTNLSPTLLAPLIFFAITYTAFRKKIKSFIIFFSIIAVVGLFMPYSGSNGNSSKARMESGAAGRATVTSDVNFRSRPEVSDNVIGTFKKGDAVTVTGEAVNGWVPVNSGGKSGFVSAKYISISKEK